MGFQSFANTQLVLELGLNSSSSSSSIPQNPNSKVSSPTSVNHRPFHHHHQPSLTLALSGDSCGGAAGGSSFSNSSVKREREVASEESERVNTSGTDDQEDEDGSVNGRKKLRLTKAQSGLLEEAFKLHTTLNPKQKQELARDLKLRPRQVEVWFQNRRARTKLKQTEVDCEYLKKCCETLKDENIRLRQEVEELKAEKVSTAPSQTVYMQLPAATLTMCPSCENTNPKTSFTMAPKPHFFNPFTTSSSAAY